MTPSLRMTSLTIFGELYFAPGTCVPSRLPLPRTPPGIKRQGRLSPAYQKLLNTKRFWSGQGARTLDPDLGKVRLDRAWNGSVLLNAPQIEKSGIVTSCGRFRCSE